MPIWKVRKFIKDILKGLDYLHDHNIVHRDIKLSNLLISQDESIKICDFGTAKFLPEKCLRLTRRELCGTLNYLAPEMWTKTLMLTTGADIWACGCVMYVLIAGHLPFNDQKKEAINLRIRHNIYKIPHELKKRIEGNYAIKMLSKLLTNAYQHRPTAAKLLKDDFFTKIFVEQSVSLLILNT